MESALSSLIIFTVALFAAVTLSFTYLETQDSLWTAEQVRQEERLERERTEIDITEAETQGNGSIVRVKVRNSGQIKLADFDRWDVVVEYYTDGVDEEDPDIYAVAWLPYTEGLLDDMQWTVSGIYVNADTLTPEAFEPGILNPDEEMVIQAQLLPTVAMTTTNRITISSPNGINATSHFTR
jgi:archaellum component FlaF (FlaF/FlaG flagellin family)